MKDSPRIVIEPLREEFIEDVIGIHCANLGYTLNSRLGKTHLEFLYRAMARDPDCYVGVALVANKPVGIISGTVDVQALKLRIIRSLTMVQITHIVSRFITHPELIIEYWRGNRIAGALHYHGKQVNATLTAIAVDPGARERGVGTKLIRALENYFHHCKIEFYRLDTLTANQPALKLYRRLNFQEMGRRAGSYLFLRVINE